MGRNNRVVVMRRLERLGDVLLQGRSGGAVRKGNRRGSRALQVVLRGVRWKSCGCYAVEIFSCVQSIMVELRRDVVAGLAISPAVE